MFDADDGTQITFGADDIWWEWKNRAGHGNPPCLRKTQEKTPVEVGIMRVAGPEGGWHQQAVWVMCL